MKIDSHFLYLASLLVFAMGSLLVIYCRERRILKKYEVIILLVVAISIPYAATDYFALKWGAWFYSPLHTLNLRYPTEIEAYAFSAATAFIVASIGLYQMAKIDRIKKRHSSKRRRLLKLRRASLAAGAARR